MDIPLGKPSHYPDRYDRGLLAPMERAPARREMGLSGTLPFVGEDVWNAYEFSWLARNGLPQVGALRVRVEADSPNIVESKSMKLYLSGFAQERFESRAELIAVLERDLTSAFAAPISVTLLDLDEVELPLRSLPGEALDTLDVPTDIYQRTPDLLELADDGRIVEEGLYTSLFRSLCPVTGQPDWASVLVRYRGPAIRRSGLLKYLVSFRNQPGFHETTIEQVFLDLKNRCRCERLLVAGYFLRRGGIDINPFRADPGESWPVLRLARQ